MTEKEKMLAGFAYKSFGEELLGERKSNKAKIYEYNNLSPDRWDKAEQLLKNIFGKSGKKMYIEQPFRCDYGYNIEVGDNFYANYNLVILDVAKVTIGNDVLLAPNVAIYTAGHPIHYAPRNEGWEYGMSVSIGNNVWVGGNTVILPGVNIGSNVVIGAGSVVNKDIPDNVIAAGNPCKVIRNITDEDIKYYYKDREF